MAEGYTIGQAYIQVLPETKNFGSTLKSEASASGEEAGSSASSGFSKGFGTAAKVAGAAVTAAATGIAAITTSAVSAYADYEQLVGGIETLYGDSADQMIEYASQAYKTAGLSANDYMETATSFAASLVSSLQGDTERASEMANLAITDMSDNANKMGTDMSSIQNAYQGFAKQNYTMLDNLKLGYGGTKTEMERLISDANALKVAQGEVGDLSIESYADIVEAIHLVQTEMGITGTTSQEAATTISGSINTMKGAWDNWLVGLADGNADVAGLTTELVNSFTTVVDNIEPVVQQILNALPEALNAIVAEIPTLLGDVSSILPGLIDAAVNLVTSLASNIDEIISPLISALPSIISSLLSGLTECLPDLLTGLGTLVGQLVAELPSILSSIALSIPDILLGLVEGVGNGIGEIVKAVFGETDYSVMMDSVNAGIESMQERVDTLVRSIDNTSESYQKAIDASEADAYAAETLTEKLNSLIAANDGTAESNREIQTVVDLLNETIPNLGLAWDAETQSLNMSTAAIGQHIAAMKLEAQEEAAKEFYVESLKEQYEAERLVNQMRAEGIGLASELGISEATYNAIIADGIVSQEEHALIKSELNSTNVQAAIVAEKLTGIYTSEKEAREALTTAENNATDAEEILGQKVEEVTNAMIAEANATPNVNNSIEEVGTTATVTAEEVKTATDGMSTATEEATTEIVNNMGEVQTAYDSVDGSGAVVEAQTTGQAMVDASDISDETGTNTIEAMDAMVTSIDTKMASLSTAFSAIVMKASEKLGVGSQFQLNLTNYGGKIPTLMSQGATEQQSVLMGAMSSIINGVADVANQLQNLMQNAGYYAGQGLYNGLSSWASALYSQAWNIANSINQAARSALQIKSPSRAMMEVGEYTVEGLALGMENNADMVTDAMDAITTDIKDGASQIADDMNNTTLGVLGGSVNYESEVRNTISGSVDTAVNMGTKGDSILAYLKTMAEKIDALSKMQMVTDTGVLAGQLAPAMNNEFATMARMEARI